VRFDVPFTLAPIPGTTDGSPPQAAVALATVGFAAFAYAGQFHQKL
jgi:hypothetical protein